MMRKLVYSLIGLMLFAGASMADVRQGDVQVTLNVPQIVSLNIFTPSVVVVPGPEDYNRVLMSFGTQSVHYWKCHFCGKEWEGWHPHFPGISSGEVIYYDENDPDKGKPGYPPCPKTSFGSLFGGWWPHGNQHPTVSGSQPDTLDSSRVNLIRQNLCENPVPAQRKHPIVIYPFCHGAWEYWTGSSRVVQVLLPGGHLILRKCLTGTITNYEYADKGFLDRAEAIRIKIFSNAQNGAVVYVHGNQPTGLTEGALQGVLRLEDTFLTVMTEKTFALINAIDEPNTQGPGNYLYQTNPITGYAEFLQMTNEAQKIFAVGKATVAPRDVVFKLGIGNLDRYTEGDYRNTLVFTLMPKV